MRDKRLVTAAMFALIMIATGTGLGILQAFDREAATPAQSTLPPASGQIKSTSAEQVVITDALGKNWTFTCANGTKVYMTPELGDREPKEGTQPAQAKLRQIKMGDLRTGMTVHISYQASGNEGRTLQAQQIVASPPRKPQN